MPFVFQIPVFLSCRSNAYFNLFGLKTNWGCVTSIVVAIFILGIILVCLLVLSGRNVKEVTQQGMTEMSILNPPVQHPLKDDTKTTENRDLFPLLLNLQQQQEIIKVDTDKLLAKITGLEQTVKDMGESTQNLDTRYHRRTV